MHVAFDASSFVQGLSSGIPLYLYHLCRALLEEEPDLQITLVLPAFNAEEADPVLGQLAGERMHVRRVGWGNARFVLGGFWLPWHPSPQRLAPGCDLFHSVDFLCPQPDGTPIVANLMDYIPTVFPGDVRFSARYRMWIRRRWLTRTPDRILVPSGHTREDAVRFDDIDPATIDVVPLARAIGAEANEAQPRPEQVLSRYSLAESDFLLSTGALMPRKNHRRLLRAVEGLAGTGESPVLVLTGGEPWRRRDLPPDIQAAVRQGRVLMPGRIPRKHLSVLYQHATLLAYPSLYEGFGLPLLEAMAADTPVVASAGTSLPEVAGDAAVFVDPESVESIRGGLRRVLCDARLRQRLVSAGRARERQFTWSRTARLTIDAYHRALRG